MGFPKLDLDGKVAVVVGATSGIGRVLALGLAEAGADVVPTGRRLSHVEEVAAEVERLGRRTARVACDVTDAGSLDAARAEIESRLGRVDILVNSRRAHQAHADARAARVGVERHHRDQPHRHHARLPVFAPAMLARGWGRIVNIASLASFVGLFEVAAYTASKAGVAGLTRALAVEWGAARGQRERHRAGRVPHGPQPALLDGTARGQEFLMRTPDAAGSARVEELRGRPCSWPRTRPAS